MSADDLRQELELKIVELIKAKLADGSMSEEKSQQMSKYVLEILKPGMTLEDLYRAIPRLDDQFQELSLVILPYLKQYEEQVAHKIREHVSELIKQGQYDAAIKLGQKAIKQDVDLVWTGSGTGKKLNEE